MESVDKFVSQVVQEEPTLTRVGRKWKSSVKTDDIPTAIDNHKLHKINECH